MIISLERQYHRQVHFFKNKEKERNRSSRLHIQSPSPSSLPALGCGSVSRQSTEQPEPKLKLKGRTGSVIPGNPFRRCRSPAYAPPQSARRRGRGAVRRLSCAVPECSVGGCALARKQAPRGELSSATRAGIRQPPLRHPQPSPCLSQRPGQVWCRLTSLGSSRLRV